MSRDRLTTSEAAQLLNVAETTMRRWVRQGLFQGADSSGGGIDREELLGWARAHGLGTVPKRPDRPTPPADLLSDAVARGAVVGDIEVSSAADAIFLAVDAVPDFRDGARARLLGEVLERERMASTGLGHGVALPPPRKPPADLAPEPVISVCFPREPLDWAALDGEPVFAVFLVLSPSAPVHLEILSRVAFALRTPEFLDFLRERPTQDELVTRLRAMRKER